jgi:cytochrome c
MPLGTILMCALLAGITSLVIQDAPLRSTTSGIYTTQQASRGREIYGAACASCHSADLSGRAALDGQPAWRRVPPLTGPQFEGGWEGMTVGDLFERIRISMPQERPASLSAQQYADLLAFLLSKMGFPPGSEELANRRDALDTIRFVRIQHQAAQFVEHGH